MRRSVHGEVWLRDVRVVRTLVPGLVEQVLAHVEVRGRQVAAHQGVGTVEGVDVDA